MAKIVSFKRLILRAVLRQVGSVAIRMKSQRNPSLEASENPRAMSVRRDMPLQMIVLLRLNLNPPRQTTHKHLNLIFNPDRIRLIKPASNTNPTGRNAARRNSIWDFIDVLNL
jgi:hypothetical protein